MYPDIALLQNRPEWYLLEKETERTIKKLTSIKDLKFYIKNPDSYTRRLAILRINELRLRDSVDILKEILDDHLESDINKNLAAWTLKAVCLKWGIDLFTSSWLLSKYTGNEKYSDIFQVKLNDNLSLFKTAFSISPVSSELRLESDDLRVNEDIDLNMPFSIKEWFLSSYREILKAIKSRLMELLPLLINKLGKALLYVLLILLHFIKGSAVSIYKRFSSKLKSKKDYYHYHSGREQQKAPLSAIFKKVIFEIFYIVFYPVRLFLKHKLFSMATLMVIYSFLTFTTFGKAVTYRYFEIDLLETQRSAYHAIKDIFSYSLDEIKNIAGLEEAYKINEAKAMEGNPTPEPVIQYIVTSKTGLNIRKGPDGASERIPGGLVPYNSQIIYLNKSQEDTSGKLWYLIKTSDGKKGWVNSKWLKKTGGE